MSISDDALQSVLTHATAVFWAGTQPPFPWMKASDNIYDNVSKNLQMDHAFEIVYLIERDLGTIKTWPEILHNALQLLQNNGMLIIRMSDTALISTRTLKNILLNANNSSLIFENTYNDKSIVFGIQYSKLTENNILNMTQAFVDEIKRTPQLTLLFYSLLIKGINKPRNISIKSIFKTHVNSHPIIKHQLKKLVRILGRIKYLRKLQ